MNSKHRPQSARRFGLLASVLAKVVFVGLLLGGGLPALAFNTIWDADTSLVVGVFNLVVLAGSKSDSLLVNPTNGTVRVVVTHPDTFTLRYPGPDAGALSNVVNSGSGTVSSCTPVGSNNDVTIAPTSGVTLDVTFTPASSPVCAAAVASGGGGGGSTYTTPFISLVAPGAGQALNAGGSFQILWSAGGTGLTVIRLTLSTDGGATFPTVIAASAYNGSQYYWTVPDLNSSQAVVKAEALGVSGTLATAQSQIFYIVGSTTVAVTPPPPPETAATTDTTVLPPAPTPTEPTDVTAAEAAAPAADPTSSGSYSPTAAVEATPTINVDKDLEPPPPEKPALCQSGSLIKGSRPSVYFCGKDGKRYVFPNERIFFTWYNNFSTVKTLADTVLAEIALGGNVTYKPGIRMIKIQTDPKTYAVARNGLLRWVKTEEAARRIYGDDWNKKIDDVPDAFFFNYKIGDPIE